MAWYEIFSPYESCSAIWLTHFDIILFVFISLDAHWVFWILNAIKLGKHLATSSNFFFKRCRIPPLDTVVTLHVELSDTVPWPTHAQLISFLWYFIFSSFLFAWFILIFSKFTGIFFCHAWYHINPILFFNLTINSTYYIFSFLTVLFGYFFCAFYIFPCLYLNNLRWLHSSQFNLFLG